MAARKAALPQAEMVKWAEKKNLMTRNLKKL